jgi:TolB-like protein/DNA-binding winged helix-turn-helix (wHTH) protein/Tfp pilus assembly protein PilF
MPSRYRLDDLIVEVGTRQVLRGDSTIDLGPLSFDLLQVLMRAAPSIVTFDELAAQVWPGLVVSPETITQRVKLLRDALDDDPRDPRYVAGSRGIGYRIVVPVTPIVDQHVDPAVTHTPVVARRLRVLALAAAGAIATVVVSYTVIRGWQASKPGQAPVEESAVAKERTVAVLPFANLSGDEAYEYFSDGLTDELLNRLGEVPGLTIAARTSSFHFKGTNDAAPAIGRMLGVRHLVEGSVRKSGGRLRITAQLVDASSGYRLWSQTYDRQVADMLDVQDEIALAVVARIEPTLLAAARDRLAQRGIRNTEALDHYLRAIKLNQTFQLDETDQAILQYEEAIRLDPDFARAHLRLASALTLKWQIAELHPQDRLVARIPVLIDRAVELDPMLGEGYAAMGQYLMRTLDFVGAERAMRRAEALSPNDADVLFQLSQYYAYAGWPPEKGVEYARRALILDPLNIFAATNVGIALWHIHDYESALREVDKVIAIDSDFWVAHWVRAAVLRDLGRLQEAMTAAQRAMALNDYGDTRLDVAVGYAQLGEPEKARAILRWLEDPNRGKYVHPTWRAWILVALGDNDAALAALEQAYAERDWVLADVPHTKHMLPLYGQPRFERLVKQLGQERRMAYAAQVYGGGQVRKK